jgi:hypothetical protein
LPLNLFFAERGQDGGKMRHGGIIGPGWKLEAQKLAIDRGAKRLVTLPKSREQGDAERSQPKLSYLLSPAHTLVRHWTFNLVRSMFRRCFEHDEDPIQSFALPAALMAGMTLLP